MGSTTHYKSSLARPNGNKRKHQHRRLPTEANANKIKKKRHSSWTARHHSRQNINNKPAGIQGGKRSQNSMQSKRLESHGASGFEKKRGWVGGKKKKKKKKK